MDLREMLGDLSCRRPIFHSEADFQHELAWTIRERWADCSIRLEAALLGAEKRSHVDVRVISSDWTLAIELKYKTRRLQATINGERFDLTNQSAQDIGRYDFCRDIERIERFAASRANAPGCAVLLTNDSAYWKQPTKQDTVDAAFRLHEGRVLTGKLAWGLHASAGTMQSREQPIHVSGRYQLSWQDYSPPRDGPYGRFKYLLVTTR